MGNKAFNLNKIISFIRKNLWELSVFFIFCIITISISCFHECWFDELQALGIAKDSLYNIIFVIPHWEGHSPLWYLILKFFNFFIPNPDILLKGINLSIMYVAVGLLIFKSPFSKIIRCLLPFTYFILYQYTVISRPYSLLILALFCAAIFYRERDTKPLRFILSLAVLSLSSAYGMAMCALICIEWGLDILLNQKQNIKTFFFKDKRFLGMLTLLFLCTGLLILMLPDDKTIYTTGLLKLPEWQRQLYFALGLTADATIANIYNYTNRSIRNLISPYNIMAFLFGIVFLIGIIRTFKLNQKLMQFIICYFGLLFFMYKTYFQNVHIGLLFIFLVYLFWCLMNDKNIPQVKIPINFKILLILIIPMQLYWSCYSCINEIFYDYSASKQVVNFIKRNNLDKDYKIMINTRWLSAQVNQYFGKNIIYSYNIYQPEKLYDVHVRKSKEELKDYNKKVAEKGIPDIYIHSTSSFENGLAQLRLDLTLVKEYYSGWIFKDTIYREKTRIWAKPNLPIKSDTEN